MHAPSTDPRVSILRSLGGMGHTVFVITPSTREEAVTLYGGWQNICEASCLEHVADMMRPPNRIFEKVRTRNGVEYLERTPGLEDWPVNVKDAHDRERCYVCGKQTERLGTTKRYKASYCHMHRGLAFGETARLQEWRNREMAQAAYLHVIFPLMAKAIEAAGFSVSGPTDHRAAEHGEPVWVCGFRGAIANRSRGYALLNQIAASLCHMDSTHASFEFVRDAQRLAKEGW